MRGAGQGGGGRMPRRWGSVAALALSPLDFFKSVSDGESTLLLDSSIYSGAPHWSDTCLPYPTPLCRCLSVPLASGSSLRSMLAT